MSEFINGAVYARDSILELIVALKQTAHERFANWAVETAQERLQQEYDEIVSCWGPPGSDFTDEYIHTLPVVKSFSSGAECAKNRITGHLGISQGEIGHAKKFSIEYQSIQWLINAIDEKSTTWENELKEKTVESLAGRLNDFYKTYDYYDYMDKLEGTEQDVIESLVLQLGDPGAVSGILDTLAAIKENGGLSEEQRLVADELVLDLAELQVGLGKSVGDVIAEAVQRSEDSKAEKMVIDILQLKQGDDLHHLRFAHLDWLDDGANSVHCRNYNHIYRYSDENPVNLADNNAVMDLLEKVYTRFNIRHPEDFRGHSLSPSDVVIVSQKNESKAFYCDWIGFKALPEKFVQDFSSEKARGVIERG